MISSTEGSLPWKLPITLAFGKRRSFRTGTKLLGGVSIRRGPSCRATNHHQFKGRSMTPDDSPMFSGSGTKSIADVREAYQTGKAEALFHKMNPDQQARFRQEFIRAAVMHAEQ